MADGRDRRRGRRGGRGPGHRCLPRPPATRIRAIASCRRAHPRRPTYRRGWGCGHRSSARRTPRSSCVTSTCCRRGWPSGCAISSQRSSESGSVPFAVTAERFEDIPAALAGLVDTVVPVPPLRDRPDDVLPLADHIATRTRGREIDFSPSASRALRSYDWPGNVDELVRVVVGRRRPDRCRRRRPVCRHEVLAGNTRHLSRIEAFERGEIVRVLTTDGLTMAEVAARARHEPSDALPEDRPVQHRSPTRTRLAVGRQLTG